MSTNNESSSSIIRDSPMSYLEYKTKQRNIRRKKLLRLNGKDVDSTFEPSKTSSHPDPIESKTKSKSICTGESAETTNHIDIHVIYSQIKHGPIIAKNGIVNILENERIIEEPLIFDSNTNVSAIHPSIKLPSSKDDVLKCDRKYENTQLFCDDLFDDICFDAILQEAEPKFCTSPIVNKKRLTSTPKSFKNYVNTNQYEHTLSPNMSVNQLPSKRYQNLNHEIQKLIDDFESEDDNDDNFKANCSPMVLSFRKRKSDKSYSSVQSFKRKLTYEIEDDYESLSESLESESFEDRNYFCENLDADMVDVDVDLSRNSHILNNLTQLDKLLPKSSEEQQPLTIRTSTPEKTVMSLSMVFAKDWPTPCNSDNEEEEVDECSQTMSQTDKEILDESIEQDECKDTKCENKMVSQIIPGTDIAVETDTLQQHQLSNWMDGLEDLFDDDIEPAEIAEAQTMSEIPVPSFLDKVMNGTLVFDVENDIETAGQLPFQTPQKVEATGFQFASGKKPTVSNTNYGIKFFAEILNDE